MTEFEILKENLEITRVVMIMDVKNESAGNNSLIKQYLDISLCIEYRDLYNHKYKIIEPIIRKDLNQEKV